MQKEILTSYIYIFFPLAADNFIDLYYDKRTKSFQDMVQDVYDYLNEASTGRVRPHLERVFSDRLQSANAGVQRMLRKAKLPVIAGRLRTLMPVGGLGHSNVHPMLLTSGVDHHLERVPMAFLMERTDTEAYRTPEAHAI